MPSLMFVISVCALKRLVRCGKQPAPFVLQGGLEASPSSGQQRLYGFVGYAHRVANLYLAHSFIVEERERQPLTLRQRLQSHVHSDRQLTLNQVCHLSRRLSLVRHLVSHSYV